MWQNTNTQTRSCPCLDLVQKNGVRGAEVAKYATAQDQFDLQSRGHRHRGRQGPQVPARQAYSQVVLDERHGSRTLTFRIRI
jgi:hypothetical protein